MTHTVLPKPALRARASFIIPLVLFCLFLLWRLTVFYVTHPAYFLDDYEEVYRGTVALELARGTENPIWNYRPDNYAGGFYVITLLLSVFLKFAGFTMFGLKSFAILVTGASMMIWYAVLARYVNLRTAVVFCLLYIFAPYRYISLSSLVFGDHAETVLLSALTVLLLFRHFQHRNLISFAALGVLMGFGVWFAYIYGLTAAAVMIFVLIYDRSRWFRPVPLFLTAAGFLLGFLFWILFNASQNFSGLVIQGQPLWEMFSLRHLWSDFFLIRLFKDPVVAANFRDSFYNKMLVVYVCIFSLTFVVSILALFRRKAQSVEVFRGPVGLAAIYTVLFIAVQQVFDMVGLRFLVPLFPFAAVVAAYGLAQLPDPLSWLRGLCFGSLMFLAVYSTGLRFEPNHAGLFLERKCYSYKTLGHVRENIRERIENVLLKDFSKLQAKKRDKTDLLMAYAGQLTLETASLPQEILDAEKRIDPEYLTFFRRFIGFEILARTQDLKVAVESAASLKAVSPQSYEEIILGMVQSSLFQDTLYEPSTVRPYLSKDQINQLANHEGEAFALKLSNKNWLQWFWELSEHYEKITPERKPYFFRGIGRVFLQRWEKEPHYFFIQPEQLDQMPESVEDYILEGVALEMFDRHLFDYESPLIRSWNELILFLPDEDIVSLVDGLKIACERWGVAFEDYIPMGKMRRLPDFYSGKYRKN